MDKMRKASAKKEQNERLIQTKIHWRRKLTFDGLLSILNLKYEFKNM